MRSIRVLTQLLTVFLFSFVWLQAQNIQQELTAVPKTIKLHAPVQGNFPWVSTTTNSAIPDFAKAMYADNPNMNVVSTLYRDWRKTNLTTKNEHTKNYKHLNAYLYKLEALDKDGSINLPTSEELQSRVEQTIKMRQLNDRLPKSQSRSGTDWTNIGPKKTIYYGNVADRQANIRAIVQCENDVNRLYCGSDNGVIFRTDDKAENWYCISEQLRILERPRIAVDPNNDDILYVGSLNKMSKSIDGGTSWTSSSLPSGFETTTVIIDKNNTNTLYASGYKGLLKSVDAGLTWTSIHPLGAGVNTFVSDIRFKVDDSQTLFCLTNKDVFKSTDGGATWTNKTIGYYNANPTNPSDGAGRLAVSEGFPNFILLFLSADFITGSDVRLIKSSNGGESWTNVYDDFAVGQGFYDWDVDVSDLDTNKIYCGASHSYATLDGFNNSVIEWDQIGVHADLQECHFHEISPGVEEFWVCTDGGVSIVNNDFSGSVAKSNGITATTFWGFDQGWNRDVQVGAYYHNGTSASYESYDEGTYRSWGGAEPNSCSLRKPTTDRVWSKGYGDIDGKLIDDNVMSTEGFTFFYNIFPNSSASDPFIDCHYTVIPYCFKHHLVGFENKIMKSEDEGQSFKELGSFGTTSSSYISNISVSRVDNDIWYIGDSKMHKLHKTTDGGLTFSTLPNTFSNDMIVALDPENSEHLWVLVYGSTTATHQVLESVDGGMTWTSDSPPTSLTSGLRQKNLLSIGGVDGGLIYVTKQQVFYKTNTIPWTTYNGALPLDAALIFIKPFYKAGKVRIASGYRGVYSNDFPVQPSHPIAQPTVDKLVGECMQDTFYFDCYSMLNHTNATWTWSFSPMPTYISDVNARNPKVVFGSAGIKSYTLTVNDGQASSTKTETNRINIKDASCGEAEEILGHSITTSGTSDSYWFTPDTDHFKFENPDFSISFWLKTTETGGDDVVMAKKDWDNGKYKGWVFTMASGYVIFNIGDGSNRLDISSDNKINDNQWHYVTMTYQTNQQLKLYIDGKINASKSTANLGLVHDACSLMIGIDSELSYPGQAEMEELVFYNKSLTEEEVRAGRHALKKNTDLMNYVVHYYQMNTSSDVVLDKIGFAHLYKHGDAGKRISNAPIYSGALHIKTVNTSGTTTFDNTNIEIDFAGGTLPNGPVAAFRLDTIAAGLPAHKTPLTNNYYDINNYGSNFTITDVTSITFSEIPVYQPVANNYRLYQRDDNEHNPTWIDLGPADMVTTGVNGSITFGNNITLTTLGQLMIVNNKGNHWIGVVNENWDEPGNWASSVVPDATTDVIIPAHTPYSPCLNIAMGHCRSILTLGGSVVIVKTGNELKVHGE